MRFFLDEDTDVAVASLFRQHGHDCWTTADAGRLQAADDDQSVYADDKNAVLVTHDVEFTSRRRAHTFGRHLWLGCEQPDAVALLERWLDQIVPVLETSAIVVVELRWEGFHCFRGWDGTPPGYIQHGAAAAPT